MDYKKLDNIYKKLVKNSIGSDKQCENLRFKKNVVVKTSLSILIATLVASTFVGCNIKKDIVDQSQITSHNEYNGFNIYDIRNCEILRLNDLLNTNNFKDYTKINGKRDYNYKVDDYKNIEELDESYLYAFYILTTENTQIEVLKSLGYSDLNDFLIKNHYTNKLGAPSVKVWEEMDARQFSEIMQRDVKNL